MSYTPYWHWTVWTVSNDGDFDPGKRLNTSMGRRNWLAVHSHLRGGAGPHTDKRRDPWRDELEHRFDLDDEPGTPAEIPEDERDTVPIEIPVTVPIEIPANDFPDDVA